MADKKLRKNDGCCHFPYCNEHFDMRVDVRMAILKKGNMRVFCAHHSKRLAKEGIVLKTISAIWEEQARFAEVARREAFRRQHEQAFIDGLKSNQEEQAWFAGIF